MKIYLMLFIIAFGSLFGHAQSTDSLFNKSMELINQQEFLNAIPLLKKAHDISPDKLNIILQLAFCYTQSDQLEMSADLYQKIVLKRPDYAQAYYMLANILLLQSKYDNALSMSNKAIELISDNADFYLVNGQVLIELGKKKAACRMFKKAKRLGSQEAIITMYKYCK